jgi:hypothetical protein
MTLLDRLLDYCRDFVQREIVDYMESSPTAEVAYAVGALVGERAWDWLAPDVVRVARVTRRDELLEAFPDARDEVAWNVAEFDLAEWPFVPHMLISDMFDAGKAISSELSGRYGSRAGEVFDRQFEIALREVAWDRWFTITDDFVVFTMDTLDVDGAQVRASLERNAPAGAIERWIELGWLSSS